MKKQIMNNVNKCKEGQAMTLLLVFVAVASVIISAVVIVTIINSASTSKDSLGEESFLVAEAGAENAIISLVRNPNYTGETMSVGTYGSAIITVTGTTTKTIISEGVVGNFRRKVQIVGNFSNNVFTLTSWTEI